MKRWMRYLATFLILFIVGGFLTMKPCLAASAEVTIGADATQVTVGDKFFVYIYIDSATQFGDFEANVTYDDTVLEYQSGASVIAGDSGFLRILDTGVLDGDTSRKYTLEFTALKVGYCDIAFSGRAVVYDFATGYEMSVSSSELTINVKAPETASANNNLKSLNISPSELTPVFNPSVLEYSTTVSYDTSQLIITAIPEDLKSTVSITGNDLLKEGENKVIVSVLAESGNVIEYTIKVTREAAPTGDTSQDAVVSPGATPGSFEFLEIDGIKYAVYNGRYTILEPDSSVTVPKGYKLGSLNLSGISVTAFIPIDNEESDFILLYAQNEWQEAGLYQYDRIEKTLQRYVPESIIINSSTTSIEEDSAITKEYKANLTKAGVIIALLAVLSALMTILSICLFMKFKRR